MNKSITKAITTAKEMLSNKTNEQILGEWNQLDESCDFETMTIEVSTVRGWYMDELEKRWPEAFSNWLENCENDDNFLNYIK